MTAEKYKLLDEFFSLRYNDDLTRERAVDKKIRLFIRENGSDRQLSDVLQLVKFEILQRMNIDFLEHCKTVLPVIERLYLAKEWDLYDLRILSLTGLCIDDLEKIQSFTNKYMRTLDTMHKDKPYYAHAKIAMRSNLTNTLLKMNAHYYEDNPQVQKKIKPLFDESIKMILDLSGDDPHFAIDKANAIIRNGVFYEDENLINNGLSTLKKLVSEDHYKIILLEIDYYNFNAKNIISDEAIKIHLAANIRKLRLNANLTIGQLSEKMDIPANSLSQIERATRPIYIVNLLKLKYIFKKSLDEIVGDHETFEDENITLEKKLLMEAVSSLPEDKIRVLRETAQFLSK